MTDKEVRKLSRKDLLQILVEQGKEIRELKRKLAEAEAALSDRQLTIDHAGSIAEAALQLNGVFAAAQAACDQYTENIRAMQQRQEQVEAYWRSVARCIRRFSHEHPELTELLDAVAEESKAYHEEIT